MQLTKASTMLAAAALAAGMALTGCSQIAESATEKLIEQAAGGSVNVDLEGDGVTIQGEDGGMAMGGNLDLPDNWPAEVPTFNDGSLVMVSVDSATGGATAMWNSEMALEDATANIKSALEGAGYTIDSESAMENLNMIGATGGAFRVDATVASQDGMTVVTLAATKQ